MSVSARYQKWIAHNGLDVVTDAATTCKRCGKWVPAGTHMRWWPREYNEGGTWRRECQACTGGAHA